MIIEHRYWIDFHKFDFHHALHLEFTTDHLISSTQTHFDNYPDAHDEMYGKVRNAWTG